MRMSSAAALNQLMARNPSDRSNMAPVLFNARKADAPPAFPCETNHLLWEDTDRRLRSAIPSDIDLWSTMATNCTKVTAATIKLGVRAQSESPAGAESIGPSASLVGTFGTAEAT
jgi:hypothetical protein